MKLVKFPITAVLHTLLLSAIGLSAFTEKADAALDPSADPNRALFFAYHDADFRGGRTYGTLLTQYDQGNLNGVNDVISSISVNAGYRVILTENNGFKGRSISITNDSRKVFKESTTNFSTNVNTDKIANLGTYNFNDKTSAIIVQAIYNDPTTPVVYEHQAFGGRKQELYRTKANYRKSDLSFGNDRISSIFVPEGYKVKLWDDDKYKDRNYVIEGPAFIPYLEGFNDKVSSLQIRYTNENFAN